jgi:AmmeMemoRadiSam system protein A
MSSLEITAEQGRVLPPFARGVVEEGLGAAPATELRGDWLERPAATFVTLHLGGALRGCIGSIRPHRTLRDDLRSNALAAAFGDPRFPPLSVAEIERERLAVSVSVLSPLARSAAASEAELLASLVPGATGLLIEWRHTSAVFLPEVWEHLAEPARFLAELKRKAGLPAGFWAHDLAAWTFSSRSWVDP